MFHELLDSFVLPTWVSEHSIKICQDLPQNQYLGLVWDIHNDITITALWVVLLCAKAMAYVNYLIEWYSLFKRQFKLKYTGVHRGA